MSKLYNNNYMKLLYNCLKKNVIFSLINKCFFCTRINPELILNDNNIPKHYYSYRTIRDKLIYNNLRHDIYDTKISHTNNTDSTRYSNDISIKHSNDYYNIKYCKQIPKSTDIKYLFKKPNKYKKLHIKKSKKSFFREILSVDDTRLTAEHIFPQSFTKLYKHAKMDAHNIYLTNQHFNSNRNNYKFVDEKDYIIHVFDRKCFDEQCDIEFYNYSNYKNTKLSLFIPNYLSRGMIARSIAYMKLTYPDLTVENVIDYDTLVEWNKQYPPQQYEKIKNDLCYTIQGNRNLFIDNHKLLSRFISIITQNN